MVRKEETDESVKKSVCKIKEDKPIQDALSAHVFYYDLHGKGHEVLKDKEVMSKLVASTDDPNNVIYYVKAHSGLLYNPQKAKGDVRYSRRAWKMRLVRRQTFDLYNRYLNSRSATLLSHAERSM